MGSQRKEVVSGRKVKEATLKCNLVLWYLAWLNVVNELTKSTLTLCQLTYVIYGATSASPAR